MTFGHLAGDFILRELASLLRVRVRREECLARHGGEEFSLVCPKPGVTNVSRRAEALRGICAEHAFTFDGSRIRSRPTN